jgi:hypothetical protein
MDGKGGWTMKLELSEEFVEELRKTLGEVIGDMSSEIADTDNPSYRRSLDARRERLRSIVAMLEI